MKADHVHTTVNEMLSDEVIKAKGLDHPNPSVVVTRLCNYINELRTECGQLRALTYVMSQ